MPETHPPDTGDPAYLAALGQRVRLGRARRGMTRQALAAASGVSARHIAQLEAGRGNVSVLVLRAVAGGLGASPAELLGDAPEEGRTLMEALLARLSASQVSEAREVLARHFGVAGERAERIALIGLRGAGKSTLGRLFAERRGVAFHELDREVERDAGMELAELFALHGQAGYRRREQAALARLVAAPGGCVVAAGGSIVADAATFGLLRAHFYTVWLRASPEEHMRRVIGQGDLRPMADGGAGRAMADLRAILQSREALYRRADATVDTGGTDVAASLAALVGAVPPPAGATFTR